MTGFLGSMIGGGTLSNQRFPPGLLPGLGIGDLHHEAMLDFFFALPPVRNMPMMLGEGLGRRLWMVKKQAGLGHLITKGLAGIVEIAMGVIPKADKGDIGRQAELEGAAEMVHDTDLAVTESVVEGGDFAIDDLDVGMLGLDEGDI